jgi:DNA-binding LacI/PurR family transcriptional regulator
MKIIGMIIPTPDNAFFATVAVHVSRILQKQGWNLILCSSDNDAQKEKEQLQMLEQLGASGILCISGLSELPHGLLQKNTHLVWIDRVPRSEDPIPWVANDDCLALEEATDFLIDRGCHAILLAPGFIAENSDNPRIRGYQKALKKHGLPFDPSYILKRPGLDTSERETEALVREHLHEGNAIDGIITSSDRAAFGAMAALRSVGCYVPEDVRLITFDNSPYAAASVPAFTAIDRNTDKMAECACEVLLKTIGGEKTEIQNVIPVSLVKRESTR